MLSILGRNTPMIVLPSTNWCNLPHTDIAQGTLKAYDKHPDFGGVLYAEGVDLEVDYINGAIRRISNGLIPDWNTKPDPTLTNIQNDTGRNTSIGNTGKPYGVWFTYDTNNLPPVITRVDTLPRLINKIKTGTSLNITYLGDSITYGYDCHITGSISVHAYTNVFLVKIKEQWLNIKNININNQAISGSDSSDIASDTNLSTRVINSPDLVVIAYGMNDQSIHSAEQFYSNIQHGIQWIQSHFPNADIILISGMLGNYDFTHYTMFWQGAKDTFYSYRPKLQQLATEFQNVAFADVTALWETAEARMGTHSMHSNDFNHPTSYGQAVVYPQVLESFLPEPIEISKPSLSISGNTLTAKDSVVTGITATVRYFYDTKVTSDQDSPEMINGSATLTGVGTFYVRAGVYDNGDWYWSDVSSIIVSKVNKIITGAIPGTYRVGVGYLGNKRTLKPSFATYILNTNNPFDLQNALGTMIVGDTKSFVFDLVNTGNCTTTIVLGSEDLNIEYSTDNSFFVNTKLITLNIGARQTIYVKYTAPRNVVGTVTFNLPIYPTAIIERG